MSTDQFTVTPAAAGRIRAIIADQKLTDGHFLRITVEGGGCAGFQYKMDMDNRLSDDDLSFGTGDARVVIDDISIAYLQGSSLEYENSLGGAFLKIKNPNAASSCGCGVSFDLKD